jgi:hypothetical protein
LEKALYKYKLLLLLLLSGTSAFIYNYFYFSKRQDAPTVQSLAVATHKSFMEIDV